METLPPAKNTCSLERYVTHPRIPKFIQIPATHQLRSEKATFFAPQREYPFSPSSFFVLLYIYIYTYNIT